MDTLAESIEAAGEFRAATFDGIGSSRTEIIEVNNARTRQIDRELAELTGPIRQDVQSGPSATSRQRALELEKQALKRESQIMKSDDVAGKVNVRAPAHEKLPGGLSRQRADFDIDSPGGGGLLPRNKNDIQRVISQHVDTKGGNSPYQSWTGERQIAVDKFNADQLAVAHIPIEEFRSMQHSRRVLSPSTINTHTTRANSIVEQEFLVHRVKKEHWRMETPEMRALFSKSKITSIREAPVYTDPSGKQFVILYRSMHPDQFKPGIIKL